MCLLGHYGQWETKEQCCSCVSHLLFSRWSSAVADSAFTGLVKYQFECNGYFLHKEAFIAYSRNPPCGLWSLVNPQCF